MATVNVLLNEDYTDKDGCHLIIIRIRDGKRKRDMGTGYSVKRTLWKDGLVIKHPDAAIINSAVETKRADACH